MQSKDSPRRRVLVSFATALALAVSASAAQAAPQTANVITVSTLGALTDVGINPRGDLLLASDGNFYSATYAGGANSVGAILQITPAGVVTNLHSLLGPGTEGSTPYSGLIEAADGNLYGTTYLGGLYGLGSAYSVSKTGTFTNLYSFTSTAQAPFFPYAGLVQAPDGNLYGTTLRGGTADAGTVFKLSLTGTLTTLYSFDGATGKNPEGALVVGADGALYGTTLIGGSADRGTVFKITTAGTLTSLYSFPGLGAFNAAGVATNVTGANPRAGLLLGADGNFYGTAYQGGAAGYGTVFRITPAGVVTALHTFAGPPYEGGNPLAGVTQDASGNLYGTTEKGGFAGAGTAWKLTTAGTYTQLHSFTSLPADGAQLYGKLVPFGGFLYGATYTDGTYSAGVLFKLDEGTGVTPPVSISTVPETIRLGETATLSWSAPTASSCVASAAWTDTVGTAGSKVVTPTTAGIYTYILTCTDGAGVARNGYTSVVVSAPTAEAVDGGGTGGGSLSLLTLALLAGAAAWTAARRLRASSAT